MIEKRVTLGEFLDILDKDIFFARIHAAQVIHDTYGTGMLVGRFHGRIKHFVEMMPAALVPYFGNKTLHKDSVDTIFFHPTEVSIHGRGII